MLINKRAQGWGTDLIIGFIIFILAILFFYNYSFNYSNETEEIIELLSYKGDYIGDSIMSEGTPTDWSEGNVQKIGILTENKINQTKLEEFYNLVQTDYNSTKVIFNTKYDYYFFLTNPMNIGGGQVDGIGKPGVTKDTINATNLLRITRFTIYENKPVTAYIYVFE